VISESADFWFCWNASTNQLRGLTCFLSWFCRDKTREKQRQKVLKRKAEELAQEPPEPERRVREKPLKPKRKQTGKQRQTIQTKEDMDELTHEYRLLKKLKKGVIDEDEYEKLTGFGHSDGGGSSDGEDKGKVRRRKEQKKLKQRGG
jgi:ATP-dependent RNA helicase DDX55/SPB4